MTFRGAGSSRVKNHHPTKTCTPGPLACSFPNSRHLLSCLQEALAEPAEVFIIKAFPARLPWFPWSCASGEYSSAYDMLPSTFRAARISAICFQTQATSSITKLLNDHMCVSSQEKDWGTLLFSFQSPSRYITSPTSHNHPRMEAGKR